MVRVGALNELVSFEKLTKVPDGAGGFTETWDLDVQVWANHSTSNLRTDAYENGVAVMKTGHNFIVRFIEVTPLVSHRIVTEDGTIYNTTGQAELFESDKKRYWKVTTIKTVN